MAEGSSELDSASGQGQGRGSSRQMDEISVEMGRGEVGRGGGAGARPAVAESKARLWFRAFCWALNTLLKNKNKKIRAQSARAH